MKTRSRHHRSKWAHCNTPDALRRRRAANDARRPATEYRMHPGDYEAFKAQTALQRCYPADWAPDSVFGLRIVQDPDAPRLPRVTAPQT